MPNRSGPDSSKTGDKQSALRCEPLLARIDPMLNGRNQQPSLECKIACAGAPTEFALAPPFFTRLVAEAGMSLPIKRAYLSEIRNLGIAWLGDALDENEGTENQNRVASIQIDQPIDSESFRTAAAIELQLFGVPFHTYPNSRRARWTPGLPIEISHFEQLSKKIDLLRNLTEGKCPIGAAMAPGAVYDDIRFLIDSGFDFITVLCQVQYGVSASQALELAPLAWAVEQSVKALRDSGAKTKLLVAGNLIDGQTMFRFLQMGASAVSIDAFITHAKPKELASVKETFGSVLTAFVPATSNTSFAWLPPAMSQLITELNDCAMYAGTC